LREYVLTYLERVVLTSARSPFLAAFITASVVFSSNVLLMVQK
jgi:hypothetical protein